MPWVWVLLWVSLALGAPALVADANQVVILSSQPQWRYTSLAPLPTERRVDLQLAQTYGALRLPLFPLLSDEQQDYVVEQLRRLTE